MVKARKGTPSKKSPAKGGSSKYTYHELAKAPVLSSEPVHFYGIITDATFPYKVNSDRFICSIKVVDPTMNVKSKEEYASVIIYAKRFEDLPIIHRLGDIIRIHRANMRLYNGRRQFNVNMHYKSSWCLYSSDKLSPLGQSSSGDLPYAYSGKKTTQEKQDGAIVATLKKWANHYFSSGNVDSSSKLLKDVKSASSDFDVCAKVLQVFELDEYTNELKIKDTSGETFYTVAIKLKFPHIKQGSVVRIRSATYDETSLNKKVLVLQHYSNIMTFISSSKLASNLGNKVSDDKSTEKASLKAKVSMTPVVLTEVDKKHSGLPNTSLHDLFHSPDFSTNTFRTCFYVTKVEPGKAADCVKSFDKKSKKTSGAKKGGDLIYQVQFLAKDVSTQFTSNAYRILLYTHEGLGGNFFATKASAALDGKNVAKLESSLKLLTRFNSWVDCVVERRNGFYFIKDTKMIF